jgi:hypothetical protein
LETIKVNGFIIVFEKEFSGGFHCAKILIGM